MLHSNRLIFKSFKFQFSTKFKSDSFLNGSSAAYLEQLYNEWKMNPSNVHPSWNEYFSMNQSDETIITEQPTISPMPMVEERLVGTFNAQKRAQSQSTNTIIDEHLAIQSIVMNYQIRGHLLADLDPLGISAGHLHHIKHRLEQDNTPLIQLERDIAQMSKKIDVNRKFHLAPNTYIAGDQKELTLKEIVKRLETAYSNHIGIEYMYLDSPQECEWLKQKIETPNSSKISAGQKRLALERLIRSWGFEAFLQKKWPSEKRFGLEGCEAMIPAMKQIIDVSSAHGVESVVIGMPHRGRLNVLANVCRKPLEQIFVQFAALEPADEGSGDVKYHLGTSIRRLNRTTNKNINISVVANPSHLETVAPVVQGKVKSEQFYKGDVMGKTVMSIILHGDAAFAGQGVVFETMHLTNLPDYTTHGTIHIVVNNQVGFTTDPRFSRSSPYCTDVGKVTNSPIFHVNSDDIDAVIHVCNLAAEYRAKFLKDVIIDLVCYRKNGHNEMDEPMFTQPLMYQKIHQLKSVMDIYTAQLIDEKIINKSEVEQIKNGYEKICEDGFIRAKSQTHIKFTDWIDSPWTGFFVGKNMSNIPKTGVNEDILMHIGHIFATPPPKSIEFVLHKGVERILKTRLEMVGNKMADWAMGEAFAYGSLLKDGVHVRLSGQDVERGTFSHRHHVLHHQTKDKITWNPLNNLYPDQARYSVCNSSLSEYGVMGFELGYSMTSPNALVMWEGQFGDFANTAQCIIDCVLSSGQWKWVRQCGLVLLLPHGYEGMGPEHSSARLERFLQLSSDDPDDLPALDHPEFPIRQLYHLNWIVANCTTPANLFHILRRQILLPFRKPLILLTPKSLLRHPLARSPFKDMGDGTEFQRVIPDLVATPQTVKRLIFCSGKVYYDLLQIREKAQKINTIALIRLEQISPFPYDLIKLETEKYGTTELVWVQEEHKNQGAWTYIEPRFRNLFKRPIKYAGRPPSASAATGSKVQFLRELDTFMQDAMDI